MQLVSNWKKLPFSFTYLLGLVIAVSPDIFNILVAHGFIDTTDVSGYFSGLIKFLVVSQLIGRAIKQKSQELAAQQGVEDPLAGIGQK